MPPLRAPSNREVETRQLTAPHEKVLEHGRRGRLANSAHYLGAVVTCWVSKDTSTMIDATTLGIRRTVDNACNAGVGDGSGTHCARLKGYPQLAVGQPIAPECRTSGANRNDFGMRSRIQITPGAVCALGDNFSLADNDCPDRHFASVGGLHGQSKGATHQVGKREAHIERLGAVRLTRQPFADTCAVFPTNNDF